jgi:hypothetical protein
VARFSRKLFIIQSSIVGYMVVYGGVSLISRIQRSKSQGVEMGRQHSIHPSETLNNLSDTEFLIPKGRLFLSRCSNNSILTRM